MSAIITTSNLSTASQSFYPSRNAPATFVCLFVARNNSCFGISILRQTRSHWTLSPRNINFVSGVNFHLDLAHQGLVIDDFITPLTTMDTMDHASTTDLLWPLLSQHPQVHSFVNPQRCLDFDISFLDFGPSWSDAVCCLLLVCCGHCVVAGHDDGCCCCCCRDCWEYLWL